MVTATWVGLDDGSPLGLSGSQAALPLWRRFMEEAVLSIPCSDPPRPRGIERHWVDGKTGLLLRKARRGASQDLFQQDAKPPRKRWFRTRPPVPVID